MSDPKARKEAWRQNCMGWIAERWRPAEKTAALYAIVENAESPLSKRLRDPGLGHAGLARA
jgi:hypothetical protein